MRTLVVWCPDWPVRAALPDLDRGAPAAVLASGQVLACNAPARREGVGRGMRRRDAQARCPGLVLGEHRPAEESHRFEEVLRGLEELSPGVAPLRPGLCALRVPARFYGGEREATAVLAERVVSLGVWDVRLGVADGVFAAEQAARHAAAQEGVVIGTGEDAAFLAPLPIDVLDHVEIVGLLRRLGLRTLGDFAALDPADVHTRFGADGALLHRLAAGHPGRPVSRRQVPPELDLSLELEPPLARIEPIAFSMRPVAERFVAALAERGLVCTDLGVEVQVDDVVVSWRRWVHPRWFGAVDIVDRVRWQLQGAAQQGALVRGPVGRVRLVPEVVEPVGDHAEALFGPRPDEKVERGLARVQGMLGPEGVLAVEVQGGRAPAERRAFTPWGERSQPARDPDRPWPGALPPPAPALVFATPLPAELLDAAGERVVVDGRGALSGVPRRFRAGVDSGADSGGDRWHRVDSWAGPWTVDERWWDPVAARRVARCQVVADDGSAWLLTVESGTWWIEARYD